MLSLIARWEEAGASLEEALSTYLNLCTSLEKVSLREGIPPKDLVTRIDTALDSLCVTLDRRTAQVRAALSKTRNNITSSLNCFPEEILVNIFSHFIYTPPNPSSPNRFIAMESALLGIYRSIYTLVGVCSSWKEIILARGSFWSTIPIYMITCPRSANNKVDLSYLDRKRKEAMSLSLARAQGCSLEVVAVLDVSGESEVHVLREHIPQIRSINATGDLPCDIKDFVQALCRQYGELPSLAELSLHAEPVDESGRTHPDVHGHVYTSLPGDLTLSSRFLESLTTLRISGLYVDWYSFNFSDRLVKLRLQEINFGPDRGMVTHLCHALSSATGLRHLEIVAIGSLHGLELPLDDPSVTSESKLSLPSLETLLIDDLYYNTLESLLGCIESRTHRFTLNLSKKSLYMSILTMPYCQQVDLGILCDALKHIPVHQICISSDKKLTDIWLSPVNLRHLMESVPVLDTLLLDRWTFKGGREYCRALTRNRRPQESESGPFTSFPSFKCLRFSRSNIHDVGEFKKMVASHSGSLRHMAFGGMVFEEAQGTEIIPLALEGDSVVISQLKEIVPVFELTDADYQPPEFQHRQWQLW